jgi:predicted metallo-beta-lactamase superfamily hydrolase
MRLDLIEAEVTVSPPLPHGEEGTPLGHVVGLLVTDRLEGRRFVFASDVQGPLSGVVAAWLIRQRPHLVYCSGPPAYLERDLGHALIEQGVENCLRVVEQTGCRVILDHYAIRDVRYRERFARLWATGRVVTAAGFLGLDDQPLEAQRRTLWAGARKPPAAAASRRPLKRSQDDAMMGRFESERARRRRAT